MTSQVSHAAVLTPAQVLAGLQTGKISPGRALEWWGPRVDSHAGAQIALRITEVHAEFWARWATWRHNQAGALDGSFHDIVHLFHLEEQLVGLMSLQPGDVVGDVGCGPAWMAQFLPKGVAYWGVDSHPATVLQGSEALARLELQGCVVKHDLMGGLPGEVVMAMIQATKEGQRVRSLARWSLYFPMPVIKQIVDQLFVAGAYDLTIDHMTAGKFNPLTLLAHLLPFLAVGLAVGRLTPGEVSRALKALRRMIPYGIEFKRLFPLWTVDQLAKALAGYRVEVLARSLFGQTTFLRVLPER